jgi:uncharacterized OsmC-like protein
MRRAWTRNVTAPGGTTSAHGFSHELLLAGAGACAAWDLVEIACASSARD